MYTEATRAAFRELEDYLAGEYPKAGLDDGDVRRSMDGVNELLRELPDRVDGYADARWLLLRSMQDMVRGELEPHQFDGEVLWSHARVASELCPDFAHMPVDWRASDVECFAFMAYPEQSTDLRDLGGDCGNWAGLRSLAELYEYLRRGFDDHVGELSESMRDRIRERSAGPTGYGAAWYDAEYGYDVRIPYVIIDRLREIGRLEWFLTHPDRFDEVWSSFGDYDGPIETTADLRDFLTLWGGPIDRRTVPSGYLEEYAWLPAIVLDFWRDIGFGAFGDGLLWACDPHEWQPVVDGWLDGLELPEEFRGGPVPLFRTAFGDIHCAVEGLDRGLKILPAAGAVSCARYGAPDSLIRYSVRPDFLPAGLLRPPHAPGVLSGIMGRLGPVGPDTMYTFGPAAIDPDGWPIPDGAALADWRTELPRIRAARVPRIWT